MTYQSAHLVPHAILDMHVYIVALSTTDDLPPNCTHVGVMVSDTEQAFKIAAKHNVPLYDADGYQMLEGDFK